MRDRANVPQVSLLSAIVFVGVLLRCAQFLSNRSLWLDESLLALNLLDRPFTELFRELDFNQGAPPGFLAVEHLSVAVLGRSEEALRAFPFAAGIAALCLFAVLARRILRPPADVVAVALFAVADGVIYYSSEVKPYALDVLACTGIVLLVVQFTRHPNAWRALLLGAFGLLSLVFSFAAAFVAVAAIVVVAINGASSKSRKTILLAAVAVAPITVGLVAAAGVATANLDRLRASFDATFIRPPEVDAAWAKSIGTDVFGMLGVPRDGGGILQWVAAILLAAGLVSLARRSWQLALLLSLPAILAIAAAQLSLYPLTLRTMLFLSPVAVLLIAEGTDALASTVRAPGRRGRTLGVAAIATAAVAGPVLTALAHVPEPRTKEELRPVLTAVRERWRPGDTLYVHYGAQYAFRYYLECDCLEITDRDGRELWPIEPLAGQDQWSPAFRPLRPDLLIGGEHGADWDAYLRDAGQLAGRGKTWVVFSHFNDDEERRFLEGRFVRFLDGIGTRLESHQDDQATALLYDFRN